MPRRNQEQESAEAIEEVEEKAEAPEHEQAFVFTSPVNKRAYPSVSADFLGRYEVGDSFEFSDIEVKGGEIWGYSETDGCYALISNHLNIKEV